MGKQNKMKRIIAILLSISIIIPCIRIYANAKEEYTFYKINIDAGNGAIGEKAIVQSGEIYISADSFSKFTRFSFDKETKTFLIKGQKLKKALKYVVIDIDKKRMFVSGTKFYDLTNLFEIDGKLYLPFCQMLPVLNADIYEVNDEVIFISNHKLSLSEVLYDFNITDYYFNIASEFYNMDWAALLTIVPNYIWDTVVDVRFDRLDILYDSGDYNDYKHAFSDFLSDDNLYLKAMAENTSIIDSTISFFNEANNTSKKLKSVYGWIEASGKTKISSEKGGKLLDSLKAYYDSGDLRIDNLKGLNDAWTKGKISFGDYIKILTYAYTYATQIEDNRKMLSAVYDIGSKTDKNESSRKAAKQVYDLYGDNIIPALHKELATIITSDTLENLSPIGIYTATAKVAGVVLETFMPFNPGDVAKLPVYSDIVLSASSKYSSYDTSTDKSTENLRLSLLLCMIASKKCYEVMADLFDDDSTYYKNKIKKIEQLIMGLYITEENTEFDSFEHFDSFKEKNLSKIKNLLGNLTVYKDFLNEVEVGVYLHNIRDTLYNEFIIHKIDENALSFSVNFYRLFSIDNATSEIFESSGVFSEKTGSTEVCFTGHIEFIDNKTISLKFDTPITYLEDDEYIFHYFGTEQDYTSKTTKDILLMTNTKKGWRQITTPNTGEFNELLTNSYYLKFNKDNSYTGWISKEKGLDNTEITRFDGTYYIRDGVLCLDKNSYDIYAYRSGKSTLTLKAKGKYVNDFSGEYTLCSDEYYEYLIESG